MGTIDVKKLAGYSLILGPVIALVCYFIQPGGILGIGGQANPTDASEVIKIASDNAVLGTFTNLLVPIGLITLLSGIMYFVQSMEGGNGHALSRLGMPFIFIAVIGWTIGSGIGVGISQGLIQQSDGGLSTATFSISIVSTILFGLGGLLIALGASTREELNSILAYIAALAAAVVLVSTFILAFATDQAIVLNAVGGVCFIIYTIWSIIIGRGLIVK